MATVMHVLAAFAVPAAAFLGLWLGGWWVLLPFAWFGGFAALFDALLPEDRRMDVPPGGIGDGRVVWFVLPVLAALLAFALHLIASGHLAGWEVPAAALGVGLVNGSVGLTASHELIHRRYAAERGLGVALAALVLNGHFRIEHVHGHHRTVGTPDDPTTARLGESFWAYSPRAFFGGIAEAWRLERERLQRRHIPVLGPRNRMFHYAAIQAALLVAAFLWAGWAGIGFFLIQAVVAIQLLMATGYIEHYGLQRHPNARGGYERVAAQHSWNSAHRMTNWTSFNLGLHAEHHRWPGKEYPELVDDGDAMRMPFGYATMVTLALVPPLWFRIMDPKVKAATAGAG
ncbi:alkane 1-monooxygenase [Indioceanicola profundi]|uniref:alkane 1-monooxygenase n=1 Tax=Indioceanicola profundi TaxID=2220096 RepID=UPI0013C476D5|nr:alkane 1-monooxygenase [Indioceanicola profundi]